MKILFRAAIPVAILVIGFILWKILGIPVETPKPSHHAIQRIKTEKTVLNPTSYQITLETQGEIKSQQATTITPLVSGTVIKVHPGFEDGAFFKEGEILLELDPADLSTAVLATESRLARAEAALIQEQARAKQARLNWQDIGYEEEPSQLVLRVPQLREAEANVSAAKADLDQASRNLERAKVKAPFDGRVQQRLVGLGQAVGATTQLGEVFGTATAEIRLPLAPSQLPFVDLPTDENDKPVEVVLTDALRDPTLPTEHQWKATIVRTEGTLDPDSRELFAIARIDDPFSLNSQLPELHIGQPMRAAVKGIILDDVYVIPRTAMRGLNRIYLIDRDALEIVKTDILPVWSNSEILIIRNELSPGDWLATSRLPYAPNGAPVDIITPPPAEQAVGPTGEALPEGS
ncbi:MAG: efflux RND transporter periplasmic adaptor subunit [Akkermansiaceae bacterium]|jgi:RND family efflux transporter MFP subunit|nr:efflux RND transporter periplasmic adaptor subunit [Akkermansiaceae bacterium]